MGKDLTRKFGVINIKLQTKKTGDEKIEAYISLFERLVKRKIHRPVAKNKHVLIWVCFKNVYSNNVKYLYGGIGKGFHFEKEKSQAIDVNKFQKGLNTNDQSKIFDSIDSEYVFVPSIHRFCIQLGKSISVNDVKKFLEKALNEVKDKDDLVKVEIENEPSTIEKILAAKKIHKIDYVISYTNDDVLKSAGELFDRRLKTSQIGKIEVAAEADHNGFLKIEGEELLEGGIQLARSNGSIKSATITNSENIKEEVSSENKPLVLVIKSAAHKIKESLIETVLNYFR